MNILHTAPRLFPLLLALWLSGCSTLSGWIDGGPPRTALRRVTVSVDPRANGGNATMLDIVFIYDSGVAPLPKTGPEWFMQKDALLKRYAGDVDVVALQPPAGAPDAQVSLPVRAARAIGVFAYANYLAEDGQPIANLTRWREVRITLLPDTVDYHGN